MPPEAAAAARRTKGSRVRRSSFRFDALGVVCDIDELVAMATEIEDLDPMVVALDAKVTPKGRRMRANSDARLEIFRGPAKNAGLQVLTKALDFAGLTKDEQVDLMLTACGHDKKYQDFKDMTEQDDGKFTEKKLDCLANAFSDTVWKLLSSNCIRSLSPTMLKEKLRRHIGKVIRKIALGTYCNSLSLMRHQEDPSTSYIADDTLFGALMEELFVKRGSSTDRVSGNHFGSLVTELLEMNPAAATMQAINLATRAWPWPDRRYPPSSLDIFDQHPNQL